MSIIRTIEIITNLIKMLSQQEEIQIAIGKIIELVYEMYIKDLKSGNISSSIKSFGKVINKKGAKYKNSDPTLFEYGGS